MKAKIDLEKFICSYVKWNNIQDALKDQGLKCWNGEIVKITQESEDERIIKAQLDYWRSVGGKEWHGVPVQETIAWLERQGQPFDDNIITRDDEMLQAISVGLTDVVEDAGWSDFGGIPIEEIQDWLEKQCK